jgi:thioredoxin-like negative regulator of GroEL
VLLQDGRVADALTLLKPRATEAARHPGLGFVYGLALAGSGRKTEARALLEKLPPESLTQAEVDLIRKSLAN